MSGTTVNEGYPYPLLPDFADVQDAFRLATAIDKGVRAAQAPFRAFMSPPSFIGRQTSAGGLFQAGTDVMSMQAIDWDNTGGLTIGDSSWRQPLAMPPSWWLFGGTMATVNSGAGVVGEGVMAAIECTTLDPVTNIATTTDFYQRNDESNTSGEWINVFGMLPLYKGSARLQLMLNGTTSKGIQLGTRFWGVYLGPVT